MNLTDRDIHHISWKNHNIEQYIQQALQEYLKIQEKGKWKSPESYLSILQRHTNKKIWGEQKFNFSITGEWSEFLKNEYKKDE